MAQETQHPEKFDVALKGQRATGLDLPTASELEETLGQIGGVLYRDINVSVLVVTSHAKTKEGLRADFWKQARAYAKEKFGTEEPIESH